MATILTKKSDTASSVPSAAQLTNSATGAELAVNTADKRLYTKDSGGNVVELGTNPSTFSLPNGTANAVPYLNGSKVLTTGSALTFDGTSQFKVNIASATSGASLVSSGNFGVRLGANSTNGALIEGVDNTGAASYQPLYIGGSDLRFTNSGTEAMRLTSTGLGIGTSSPGYKLDATIGSVSGAKMFRFSGASGQSMFGYVDAGGVGITRTDPYNSMVYLGTGNTVEIYTASTQRAVFDSSGNLGLGVTPSAWNITALQVKNGSLYGAGLQESGWYSNAYYNAGWKYISTGYSATGYTQNGSHQWFTAPSGTAGNAISFTQSMTLDASGNLLVGTTSTTNGAIFRANGSGEYVGWFEQGSTTTNHGVFVYLKGNRGSDNTTTAYRYGDDNNIKFQVLGSGNVQNANNSYGAISDAKLKENVTDATPKLAQINQVRVVNYNLIGQEQKQIGVIAQELEQIFPGMVEETPDRDKKGNDLGTTTKSVKYSVFVPMLIKAMQEQQAQIEQLRAEIKTLKGN